MKEMTKRELIEAGFAPSPKRAKLSIPFMLPLTCWKTQFNRLPKELKAKYSLREGGEIAVLIR